MSLGPTCQVGPSYFRPSEWTGVVLAALRLYVEIRRIMSFDRKARGLVREAPEGTRRGFAAWVLIREAPEGTRRRFAAWVLIREASEGTRRGFAAWVLIREAPEGTRRGLPTRFLQILRSAVWGTRPLRRPLSGENSLGAPRRVLPPCMAHSNEGTVVA